MAQDTLFHILRRQPWWISILVAIVIFWIAYAIFPPVAPFIALPFVLLALYIAIVQWRRGTPGDVGARLAELRAMSWETFSAAVADAYRNKGYAVSPSEGRGYDFKLTKQGEVILLQCRRWKVNQVGAAPVRELAEAVDRADARRGICIAAGDFSAPARAIAAGEPVTLLSGSELVELVRVRKKKNA
ncbi:MAG TPA: restriction endonuclease [Burkholderiales bacterium]|nr:restriction endonuclease [Burkholderiales bacterium]